MKMKINKKRAFVFGFLVLIIYMIIGNLLYMNPLVMNVFEAYQGHPSAKPMEFFGGQGNWIMLNSLFSIILTSIHIVLFLIIYKGLPGNKWSKGIFFGVMVGLVSSVPEAFNQWMIFDYPNILILIPLVNNIISYILLGLLMTYFFNKFKVLNYEK